MKNLLLFLLLPFLFSCANKISTRSEISTQIEDHQKVIAKFIKNIQKNDKEKISSLVSYPLRRENPIPDITNEKEFLAKYDGLFEEDFKQKILNSNPLKDWEVVGSKGIMMHNGLLWLDFAGNLTAVNYESKAEQAEKAERNTNEKLGLHPSIKEFIKPVLVLETETSLVRIDEVGTYKFRYASWPIGKEMNTKPSVIVGGGQYIPEGSGGNHRYVFTEGDYKYDCFVIRLGANDSPPAILSIFKEGSQLSSEPATKLEN